MTRAPLETIALTVAFILLASAGWACGDGSCIPPVEEPPVVNPEPPVVNPEPPVVDPEPPTDGDSEQPGQSVGRNWDICCVRDDGAVLFKSPLHLWGPQQCLKDVAAGKRPKCGGEG